MSLQLKITKAAERFQYLFERHTEAASRIVERADQCLLVAYSLRLAAHALARGDHIGQVVVMLNEAELPAPNGQPWSAEVLRSLAEQSPSEAAR